MSALAANSRHSYRALHFSKADIGFAIFYLISMGRIVTVIGLSVTNRRQIMYVTNKAPPRVLCPNGGRLNGGA